MSNLKLLLTGAFKYDNNQLNELMLLGYEIIFIQDERVLLEIDLSDIDAVVCNSLFLYNDIKRFEKLNFIQLTSVGLDRVPLDYIKMQQIKLFNARGVYSVPMAEWIVLKILEFYKKSEKFYKAQQAHKWEKQRGLLELTDKNVAIIGFGDVGSETAKRLKVFGVNIIAVGRRYINRVLSDKYFLIDEINEALKISDIVILTLPLTKETRHLIDSKKLAYMKSDTILINVSRGEIIDELALYSALEKNKFLGVALDVFQQEPLPKESPLWDIDRVSVTPHNSFVSDNVTDRLYKLIYKNLKSHIKNKES